MRWMGDVEQLYRGCGDDGLVGRLGKPLENQAYSGLGLIGRQVRRQDE
jgi:hypothetical protein